MEEIFVNDFIFVLPEFLFMFSLLLIIPFGVTFNSGYIQVNKLLSRQILVISLVTIFFIFLVYADFFLFDIEILAGVFSRDSLKYLILSLVFFGVFLILCLSDQYMIKNSLSDYELVLLILCVLLGSICILFSNEFLTIYLGIELQGLSLYILATLKPNSTYSTEAGLKYFILGAFASSILLFGLCLFYGATGILNLNDLKLLNFENYSTFLDSFSNLAVIFIFVGLIFKVGGAPFHFWVPDVYEGVPTLITAFFSIIPKLVIFSLFVNLVYGGFLYFCDKSLLILLYSGIFSVIIGSLGGLNQLSIKRLLSYSAIAQAGFILYGISTYTTESFISVLLYLIVYVCLLINLFSILLTFTQRLNGDTIKLIKNLRYLLKYSPLISISFALSLFGLAGIPPLNGFFSKLLIFFAAIKGGYILTGILCIMVSIIGCVYYLYMIRTVSVVQRTNQWLFFTDSNYVNSLIISYSLLINLLFLVYSDFLLSICYNVELNYFI